MRGKFVFLLIVPAFLAIAVALHYPGFHSRMVYDSVGYLLEKESVFAGHDPVAVMSMVPQRPLFMLTLYLNYLSSGTDPWAYRLMNAILLAGSGLALVFATWMLLQNCGASAAQSVVAPRRIAVIVGLSFVVHPLQGFAVLYVWQRSALMACLFSFATIGTYLAARGGKYPRNIPAYVLTGILCAAGMLSKENVAMVPIVLFLAEIILFKQPFKDLFRRGLIIAAITLPGIIVNVVATFLLLGPATERGQEGLVARVVSYYKMAGISPIEVMLTQCRVIFAYLRCIVVPTSDSLPFLRSFTVSRSLVDPMITLFAAGGVTALLLAAVIWCRKRPLACFGLFLFFITLIPESCLIPQYLYFGHRPILPMAGVFLIMADCALRFPVLDRRQRSFKVMAAMALLLPALYWGSITFERSRSWSPLRFWEEAYAQLPPLSAGMEKFASMDIMGNYASELSYAGRHAAAVDVLKKALEIDFGPLNEKTMLAKVKLGTELFRSGRNEEGLRMLKRIVAESPDYWWATFQLATALAESGDRAGAVDSLKKFIQLDGKNAAACVFLGNLLAEDGQFSDAVALYEKALQQDPRSADTYTRLGIAREKTGDAIAALENYRKAVVLSPRSPQLQFNLAKTLAKLGQVPDAIAHYQRAVELNPSFGPAYANLGTILLESGRMSEAVSSLEKALAIIPHNAELHFQVAIALLALRRTAEAREHLERALAMNPHHAGARQALDRLTASKGMESQGAR